MHYKKNLSLGIAVLLGYGLVFILNSNGFAQSTSGEKTRIKDFGQSLRKKDSANNKKSTGSPNDDEDVIKVETNLVRTDVLVINQKGSAIIGLKADNFIITEDNTPQEIGTFSFGDNIEVPRSIVLIIDYSGSQRPFIENSVAAAKVLVDKLNPKDRMAIVTDDIELITPFTKDKELLKSNLDSLARKAKHKFGKSLQYSALLATLNELFDTEDIRPIIIFQTDGDEAASIKTDTSPDNNYRQKSFTVTDLFNAIGKSRATIYSVISGVSLIGFSPQIQQEKVREVMEKEFKGHFPPNFVERILPQATESLYNGQASMVTVARESGGFAENLETPEQADEIYSRILNDINNRYLIGYYPVKQEHDGKRRNVKIEVRGHPEYIVWGRKTYFAP